MSIRKLQTFKVNNHVVTYCFFGRFPNEIFLHKMFNGLYPCRITKLKKKKQTLLLQWLSTVCSGQNLKQCFVYTKLIRAVSSQTHMNSDFVVNLWPTLRDKTVWFPHFVLSLQINFSAKCVQGCAGLGRMGACNSQNKTFQRSVNIISFMLWVRFCCSF